MTSPFSNPTLAARLARLSGLNGRPQLKQAVKEALYFFEDPFGTGRKLEVGGVQIRVPTRFCRPPWTDYETTSTKAVAGWLATRPDAALLDIGCSVGIYSLLALASSPRTSAWAFDSDLVSLQATRWLCSHVSTERLNVIFGFVTEKSDEIRNAAQASRETTRLLEQNQVSREPAQGRYVCLDGTEHPQVPANALDQLFPDPQPNRPWLLKCDVEGAEMLVLRGADQFVRSARPQLLISVHPETLAGFGYQKSEVARWIDERGYERKVLSIDHEEHWWCTPTESPVTAS